MEGPPRGGGCLGALVIIPIAIIAMLLVNSGPGPSYQAESYGSSYASHSYQSGPAEIPTGVWYIAGAGALYLLIGTKTGRGLLGGFLSAWKPFVTVLGLFMVVAWIMIGLGLTEPIGGFPPGLIAICVAILVAGGLSARR